MSDLETPLAPPSLDGEYEATSAIRKWYEMRNERDQLAEENRSLRETLVHRDAHLDALNSANTMLRSELEHYRLKATEAGVQLRHLRSIINDACLNLSATPMSSDPEDDKKLRDLAKRLAPENPNG